MKKRAVILCGASHLPASRLASPLKENQLFPFLRS